MEKQAVLHAQATLDELYTVLDFVQKHLEEEGFSPMFCFEMEVAAEEIFTNICHHAYEQAGPVQVRFAATKNDVLIEFSDSAPPFNPLAQEAPALDGEAAEREEGGLGIHLAKELTSHMHYTRQGECNILTLTKERPTPKRHP